MYKIVLLDDSPTIQRVVNLAFSKDTNLSVNIATKSDNIIQELSTNKPDICIVYIGFFDTENKIPKILELKNVTKKIIVITDSDYNTENLVNNNLNLFIKKPFQLDNLKKMIDTAIDEIKNTTPSPQQTPPPQSPTPPPAPPPAPEIKNTPPKIELNNSEIPETPPAVEISQEQQKSPTEATNIPPPKITPQEKPEIKNTPPPPAQPTPQKEIEFSNNSEQEPIEEIDFDIPPPNTNISNDQENINQPIQNEPQDKKVEEMEIDFTNDEELSNQDQVDVSIEDPNQKPLNTKSTPQKNINTEINSKEIEEIVSKYLEKWIKTEAKSTIKEVIKEEIKKLLQELES